MKFKCQYCGKNIDIRKVDKYTHQICEKPVLFEVIATCKHCHRQQRVTVMDTLQKYTAEQYGKVLTEMQRSGGFFRHPAYHAELLKKKLGLESDILHRHRVLMEKMERLKQEGVLMDGK